MDGPAWSDRVDLAISDAYEVTRQYRLWVNTWIVHELDHLVPELARNPSRGGRRRPKTDVVDSSGATWRLGRRPKEEGGRS